MDNNKKTDTIKIVTYEPQYQEAFKSLNIEWISKYFEIEAADTIALDHPKEYILDKGGEIFIALLNDEAVGVCAMIKMQEDFDYEMAKMAVSPKAQGKGIGLLLGRFVIDWAAQNNATTIYLESNTQLEPAINLYYKLGFKEVKRKNSPYKRANIQMLLELKSKE